MLQQKKFRVLLAVFLILGQITMIGGLAHAFVPKLLPPNQDDDPWIDADDDCPTQFSLTNNGCPAPQTNQDDDPWIDHQDQCPEQFSLVNNGCPTNPPADRDGDLVPDNLDQCPDVRAVGGCPLPDNTDGDLLPDAQDQCPQQNAFTTSGCVDQGGQLWDVAHVPIQTNMLPQPTLPIITDGSNNFTDTDLDLITDAIDECPNEPALTLNGCPLPPFPDNDGDLIPNDLDKCPDEFGSTDGCPGNRTARVTLGPEATTSDTCQVIHVVGLLNNCFIVTDETGDLTDQDRDGFTDGADTCPDKRGLFPNGCPIDTLQDTDGDGVTDGFDVCYNQPGLIVLAGCPSPVPPKVVETAEQEAGEQITQAYEQSYAMLHQIYADQLTAATTAITTAHNLFTMQQFDAGELPTSDFCGTPSGQTAEEMLQGCGSAGTTLFVDFTPETLEFYLSGDPIQPGFTRIIAADIPELPEVESVENTTALNSQITSIVDGYLGYQAVMIASRQRVAQTTSPTNTSSALPAQVVAVNSSLDSPTSADGGDSPQEIVPTLVVTPTVVPALPVATTPATITYTLDGVGSANPSVYSGTDATRLEQQDFVGTADNETVHGNSDTNNIQGGDGNDTIYAYEGSDTVDAGAGDDMLVEQQPDGAPEVFEAGSGTDTLFLQYNPPAPNYTRNVQVVGDGTGTASVTVNYLFVPSDGDVYNNIESIEVESGTFADHAFTLAGSGGSDAASSFTLQSVGSVRTAEFIFTAGVSGYWSIDIQSSILRLDFAAQSAGIGSTTPFDLSNHTSHQNVTGSLWIRIVQPASNNVAFVGSNQDDYVAASTHNYAAFTGNGGNDTFIGGAGQDVMEGGAGNDTLIGNGGNDILSGQADDDTLDGGDGNDALNGGTGIDTIAGGTGTDTVTYQTTDDIAVNLSNTVQPGITGCPAGTVNPESVCGTNAGGDWEESLTSVENVNVGSNYPISTVGSGDTVIYGNSGDNIINTGDGADLIYAGDGNDFIDAGDGANTVFAEGGDDYLLDTNDHSDLLDAGTGTDTIEANDGDADVIVTADGGDTIICDSTLDTVNSSSCP